MSSDPKLYAFPCVTPPGCSDGQDIPFGLTKRELFAAMAMQGALGGTPGTHLSPATLARESVEHADYLIAELEKARG